jgi:hypothetical protein
MSYVRQWRWTVAGSERRSYTIQMYTNRKRLGGQGDFRPRVNFFTAETRRRGGCQQARRVLAEKILARPLAEEGQVPQPRVNSHGGGPTQYRRSAGAIEETSLAGGGNFNRRAQSSFVTCHRS